MLMDAMQILAGRDVDMVCEASDLVKECGILPHSGKAAD